jgi:hypothetical protein
MSIESSRSADMAERQQRLSYKFQRLRERLREAIETGVLSGKLPGERVLARQFRVNAKTLSKALTDLAAEGLLERTIGRGTFVRGQAEEREKSLGKWLIISRPGMQSSPLAKALLHFNPDCEVQTDLGALRPSFLNGFTAVIDLHGHLPEQTLRDLILRNLNLILVDSFPKTYSTHSVLVDRHLCAGLISRDLSGDGFTSYVVVDDEAATFEQEFKRSLERVDPDAKVSSMSIDTVGQFQPNGQRTAFVCANMDIASHTVQALKRNGVNVPADAAVVGVGVESGGDAFHPCSGYVVSAEQVAEAVKQLLSEGQSHRPTPLWLVGSYADHGTHRAKSIARLEAAGTR